MFLVGYVAGPIVWGPGSELVGRKPIMLGTVGAYTILHLGQALAQNIETILVTRFLAGFFACAPLVNSGGLIADIWDPAGRGLATSLFTMGVFIGPVCGPIASAFIVTSTLGWRWVYWVMMIFAGACWLLAVALLPETYAPILLMRKAQRLRKSSPEHANVYAEHEKQDWAIGAVAHRSVLRPFKMLAMEPILLLITLFMSVIYGLLYGLFEALPIIFMDVRGFTPGQSALIFIGVGIGTTLGSVLNWWLSRDYAAVAARWRGFPPPEERLTGAMIASPALVIGCFWLGWSGNYAAVPWYVPALSTILIGFAISLIFMSFLAYIVDTYLMSVVPF
jgi:DHA1 family multidrug resistance protein-like MFS transporter